MSGKAESLDSSSSLKIYLRLLSYIRPYLGFFALSILGFLIFASTQPMLGYILKYFVDGLSNPDASLFPSVPYLRDLQLVQAGQRLSNSAALPETDYRYDGQRRRYRLS